LTSQSLKITIQYTFMKSLALCVAILFVTMGAMSTMNHVSITDEETVHHNEHIALSESVTETTTISMDNCGSLAVEHRPVVPVYTRTYILPAGSTFTVEAHPVEVNTLGNIELPASPIRSPPGFTIGEGSYDADIVYPETWYTYDAKGGMVNGQHVTILSLYLYPVRYVAGEVIATDSFEVTVSYEPPAQPLFANDAYDLLIVCPNAWEDDIEPLVAHKESHGIKTKVVCLECMLNGEYFEVQGRDTAEKLKYFIKDAVEEWGIQYVLLVGGRKPGVQEDWFIPVRYVHVFWADEHQYMSDLYYADIYDANYSFSSWDTDGNGVYSEWGKFDTQLKDELDLYPDVYVGRWACRSSAELKIMIEKTISYESTTASKRIVLAGGDNFEMEGIEGEIVCDKSLSYLPGFEGEKVYVSNGDVTSARMKAGLDKGAAFIHLHGHGSPIYWSTHKVNGFDQWEDGLKVYDLPLFFNKEYPIAVIGGCHTAMFNMSLTVHPWTGGIPWPEGISWWFARKWNGGAIAALGYTAFPVATPGEDGDLDGDGVNDPDCAESGYGYMQLEFFKAYGMEGRQHLGECWAYAVGSYTDHFKIPYERYHLHTIQAFVLLGDPSLKIGGY